MKKYSDRNRMLHEDTSTILHGVQEKLVRNFEDVGEMLDRI